MSSISEQSITWKPWKGFAQNRSVSEHKEYFNFMHFDFTLPCIFFWDAAKQNNTAQLTTETEAHRHFLPPHTDRVVTVKQ